MPTSLLFRDLLHGDIEFPNDSFGQLIGDLLATPEVQRLRLMRLMNFDVPFIQDLATARRLAHSIGAAYLTHVLVKRSFLAPKRARTMVAAALLHDIGIPPYGHLVETHLKKKWPGFSHEAEVKKILYGTYHPTNKYHQILPTASLKAYKVLRRHDIDIDEVLELISPVAKGSSPVASDIDVDNLDTVHRMATFLGDVAARSNLTAVMNNCRIVADGGLAFDAEGLDSLVEWQRLRESIYTMIIAHPNFVAYNAFLTDMVRAAVDHDIITPDNWFLTDAAFEQLLHGHPATSSFSAQLIRGCEYELLDYVWFKSSGVAPAQKWSRFDVLLESALGPLDEHKNRTRFFWVEAGLVSRAIDVNMKPLESARIGESSVSVFVALVGRTSGSFTRAESGAWRSIVIDNVNRLLPDWHPSIAYPENYTGHYGSGSEGAKQLEIFGFAS